MKYICRHCWGRRVDEGYWLWIRIVPSWGACTFCKVSPPKQTEHILIEEKKKGYCQSYAKLKTWLNNKRRRLIRKILIWLANRQ